MLQTTRFTVLGADKRLIYTAETLREQGFTVTAHTGTRDALPIDADILILPVPLTRDGRTLYTGAPDPLSLETLAESLNEGVEVFCGMPGSAAQMFFRRGIRLYDYAAREEFAIRNASPTAEGVADLLIRTLPITVRGAQILITGYGRTARACARLLYGMGARITVAARRCSALAAADSAGYRGLYLREIARYMSEFDAVVNTVPAPVLGEKELRALRRDCPILEIASAPWGVDFEAAKRFGVAVQTAPSLPGKIAPKTAGIILADTVLNILREGTP